MLTRSGLGAAIGGLVLAAAGWWWGYEELVIAAATIFGLMLMAVWVSQRPLRTSVQRHLPAVRIPRGDPIVVVYRLRNSTRFRSGRATVVDGCDGVPARTSVPPLAPTSERNVTGTIATRRRGVFDVGPMEIERVDPFWLTVGTRRRPGIDSVIVHPKVYDLIGPQGAVRVVESESVLRRATADPLSGFVSMREYVSGDDPRMIHWPTTARTGTLMVREHVEVRRPEFTVVLDTSSGVAEAADFEEMVDVAATLAVHAIRSGLDVVVRTTSVEHGGSPIPLRSEAAVLDLLTPVGQTAAEELVPVEALFTRGFDHTAVVILTGPIGPSSMLATSQHMSVVRIGVGALAGHGVTLAAADAREFVRRWRSIE